jgi:hypothetical protein
MHAMTAKEIVAADKTNTLEVYPDYSGRGMFGKTTSGIVGDKGDILTACSVAGVGTATLHWDNMGKHDMIAY